MFGNSHDPGLIILMIERCSRPALRLSTTFVISLGCEATCLQHRIHLPLPRGQGPSSWPRSGPVCLGRQLPNRIDLLALGSPTTVSAGSDMERRIERTGTRGRTRFVNPIPSPPPAHAPPIPFISCVASNLHLRSVLTTIACNHHSERRRVIRLTRAHLSVRRED
jgi:hypothetical protein